MIVLQSYNYNQSKALSFCLLARSA